MSHRRPIVLACLFALLLVAAACAMPTATPAAYGERSSQQSAPQGGPQAQPTAAAARPAATAALQPASTKNLTSPTASSSSAADTERLVIKDAEIDLLVTDGNAAIDQVLGVASDVAGYVLSTVTWEEANFKLAKITLRMPADRFEEALRRLNRIGRVAREQSSGQDVTDEYVDLQSQLRNLEATAERLRGFLDKATTVEEALKVNETLKVNEAEIEKIKGRLNYLSGRAAYSTITVYIQPDRATPTPTATATPTPTPTPAAWSPVRTAKEAGSVLLDILRGLINALIWVLVLFGPFVVPIVLVVWFFWWRKRKKTPRPPETPTTPAPPSGA